MDTVLFQGALIAYFFSTFGYIVSLIVKRVIVAKTATWVLAGAVVIQTLAIALRWLNTGYGPVIGIHETLSFSAWVISGVYLAFQLRTKTRILGAFVSPLALSLMLVASIKLGGEVCMPVALQGPWVSLHVILSLGGEALFALACCAGIMYLIQDNLIKNKKMFGFSKLLPSLNDLDMINYVCILWGFILLTVGIIVGSVWARTVWGSHWQWDPKQVATLVTWVIYALLLHQRVAIGWRGKKAAYYSIIAFLLMICTLGGVMAVFDTVHDFTC